MLKSAIAATALSSLSFYFRMFNRATSRRTKYFSKEVTELLGKQQKLIRTMIQMNRPTPGSSRFFRQTRTRRITNISGA